MKRFLTGRAAPRRRVLPLALCCVLAAVSAGCGYDSSGNRTVGGYQWSSLYPTNVRTVAVPIFGTRDFHRGVEFEVTDALVHQIEAFTPYKVVSRDHADTILEGEVVSVQTRPLSLSPVTGTPQEEIMSLVVDFTWKDLRSGKILVQKTNFEQTTTYYPTLGEGEFVGSQNAAEKLAAGIVDQMQAAW